MVFFLLVLVEELLHDNFTILEFPFVVLDFFLQFKVFLLEGAIHVEKLFRLAFEVVELIVERPDFVFLVFFLDHGIELGHNLLGLLLHLRDLLLDQVDDLVFVALNTPSDVLIHHVNNMIYLAKVLCYQFL